MIHFHPSTVRVGLLALFLLGTASGALACKKAAAASTGDPSASSTPSPSSEPAPLPSAAYTKKGGVLVGRLAEEAASRPKDTPSAEAAFAAFTKAGVPLHGIFQHLGSPIFASYCASATTEANTAMSVCEYGDEATLQKGKAESAKAFAAIPNRDIYVNKKTTLTLLLQPKNETTEADGKKLVEIFSAL
jgi:hypothetical protein